MSLSNFRPRILYTEDFGCVLWCLELCAVQGYFLLLVNILVLVYTDGGEQWTGTGQSIQLEKRGTQQRFSVYAFGCKSSI